MTLKPDQAIGRYPADNTMPAPDNMPFLLISSRHMVFKITLSSLLLLSTLALVACKKESGSVNPENRKEKLTLQHVIAYANSHKNKFPKQFSRTARFSSFDFTNLIPSHDPSGGNQLDVFYSNHDQIIKIIVRRDRKKDYFEFNVIKNEIDNYTILYPNYFNSNRVHEHVGGFIFNYQQHAYFITYGDNPFCVMSLDSNLHVISTLRTLKFYPDSLYFKTRVNYRGEHLDSETFYAFQKPLSNNASTRIDDVVERFTSALPYTHEMRLQLGIAESDKHLPLWLWNGHQQYDTEITPITKSIEIRE